MLELADFARESWFDLVQTLGIVASLLLALRASRRQEEVGRVQNGLGIAQHHREIWTAFLENPALERVFDPQRDPSAISVAEQMFVNFIFLHMSAVLRAMKANAIPPVEGMERDLREILSHPVPRAVWREVRHFHDRHFREFVDAVVRGTLPPNDQ